MPNSLRRRSLLVAGVLASIGCGPAVVPDAGFADHADVASRDTTAPPPDAPPARDVGDDLAAPGDVVAPLDVAPHDVAPHDVAPPPDAGHATGFRHPGVLVDGAQLDFVRGRIAAGAEPWTSALAAVRASRYGGTTYTPMPVARIVCGSNNVPDMGCTRGNDDAIAAYTQALLWYYTGNHAYAANAIAILNAWSSTLTGFETDLTVSPNTPLVAAWLAEVFPRAAEIVRYSSAGWSAADATRFGTMLTTLFLPRVLHGWAYGNGNWELSMADADINIGVYNDDMATFDTGVALWRARVPAYFYLASDGPVPVAPPGGRVVGRTAIVSLWQDGSASRTSMFVDGREQETCRDFVHLALGLASTVNAAETAYLQGVDLYTEQQPRLTRMMELHASILNQHVTAAAAAQARYEAICGGSEMSTLDSPTWEIAYDAYATRARVPLPSTLTMLGRIRPTGVNSSAFHQMAWETLTHAGTGAAH